MELTRKAFKLTMKITPRPVRRVARKFYTPPPLTKYGETIVTEDRIGHLVRLVEETIKKGLPGDLIECGVFRGGSAIQIASAMRRYGSEKRLHAIDLFEGFDIDEVIDSLDEQDEWDQRRVNRKFAGSRFNRVVSSIDEEGLSNWVTVHKGAFAEVFPSLGEAKFCFAHIDCDYYSSVKDCVDFLKERLVPGGIALFDDYGGDKWPGVKKALHELLDPDSLTILPSGQAYWTCGIGTSSSQRLSPHKYYPT